MRTCFLKLRFLVAPHRGRCDRHSVMPQRLTCPRTTAGATASGAASTVGGSLDEACFLHVKVPSDDLIIQLSHPGCLPVSNAGRFQCCLNRMAAVLSCVCATVALPLQSLQAPTLACAQTEVNQPYLARPSDCPQGRIDRPVTVSSPLHSAYPYPLLPYLFWRSMLYAG